MEVNKIISFFLMGCSLYSCNSTNIDNNVSIGIQRQEVLYDSTNIKGNKFSIKLFTNLEFKNDSNKKVLLKRSQFNDFYIVFKNDTLPLIPKTNKLTQSVSANTYMSIEYISYISQLELEYDNEELEKEIKNSPVVSYSNNKRVEKKESYFVRSLIVLWESPPDDNSIE